MKKLIWKIYYFLLQDLRYMKWLLKKPDAIGRFRKNIEVQYERTEQILKPSVEIKKEYGKMTEEDEDILVLPRIVISVTNKCSLRCKDCNNLIPYFKEKYDMGIEELLKDIKAIFKFVDKCVVAEIIGGEPFLYKQFGTVLHYLLNEEKIDMVEITTNGTIIPQKEWIPLLKDSKCYVMISDYGKVNADRKQRLVELFSKEKINYKELITSRWVEAGSYKRRNKSTRRLEWEYNNCGASIECRTLWKGKLFTCGRAPALYELEEAVGGSNYLDIRGLSEKSIQEGKAEIRKFYLRTYCECCDHCDYAQTHPKFIPNGIQLK